MSRPDPAATVAVVPGAAAAAAVMCGAWAVAAVFAFTAAVLLALFWTVAHEPAPDDLEALIRATREECHPDFAAWEREVSSR